jgi:hypothetical protein
LIGESASALARQSRAAYLRAMSHPVFTSNDRLAARPPTVIARTALVWGGAGLAALLMLGALTLWFYYGTTVFFEMIAAGFSACF